MDQTPVPLLGAIVLVPLAGLVALALTRQTWICRTLAGLATLVELALTLWLVLAFETGTAGTQFAERYEAGPLALAFGVDGASILFLPLTAFLGVLTVTLIGREDPERQRHALMTALLLEWSLIGAFASLTVWQFWLFGIVELGALLGALAGAGPLTPERRATMLRLLTARGIGDGLILCAAVLLAWDAAGATRPSWDTHVGLLLGYGILVRLAVVPFHAWLPAVTSGICLPLNLLVMASLKVGMYGLLRFIVPVLATSELRWLGWAAGLCLAGMIYAALMALLQQDLRRLIAYSAISQNGVCLMGVLALNAAGLEGGLLLALSLGLATATLYYATALIHQRTGTSRIDELGGLFERVPTIGLTFLAAALGTLAMPGTPGFEAAHLALEGMLAAFHWSAAYAAAAGNVLVASVILWVYQRAFFSWASAPNSRSLADLAGVERLVAAVVCLVIFGVGLYANPWIETVSATLAELTLSAQARGGP